ncbi:MAG: PadR family transcriptional regulator [Thermodesulfobacteriota bacterium]
MLKFLFLGFVRIHILHHACEGPIYGTGIKEELARHGYNLSPGMLYPVLHGLGEQGFLLSRSEVVDGKVRKYHEATAKGREALEEARERIAELVEEVLGDERRGRDS